MFIYALNKDNSKPLYLQLYESIKINIKKGKIIANEKLPSKRVLAEQLKLSVVTVQNAYAQLIAEGYIYAQEKKGYFACEISYIATKNTPLVTNSYNNIPASIDEPCIINLCENSIDSEKFPFSVWSKQMRQVISENYAELLCKVPNMGLWSLRKAICDYLYRFRGMVVDPNLVLIGAGTEYLYGLIIKLLGRDKIYAVENPGYKRIAQIINAEGLVVKHIPLDQHGLRADALVRENVDVVYTSPSHNFPTGIVMPIKRRMEILSWAHADKDRYIIEDDYDSEFRFACKPLPTMQSIDSKHKTIYINTFTKTIAPSLRISYMILTPELAKKYNDTLGFYTCPVCSFEQYILTKFINDKYYERHINRMKKFYKQRRDAILNLIASSSLGKTSQVKEELSGLHFVLKLQTTKSDSELKALARSYGVSISFLSEYCSGDSSCSSSEIIINYSGIAVENMKKAIAVLVQII